MTGIGLRRRRWKFIKGYRLWVIGDRTRGKGDRTRGKGDR